MSCRPTLKQGRMHAIKPRSSNPSEGQMQKNSFAPMTFLELTQGQRHDLTLNSAATICISGQFSSALAQTEPVLALTHLVFWIMARIWSRLKLASGVTRNFGTGLMAWP